MKKTVADSPAHGSSAGPGLTKRELFALEIFARDAASIYDGNEVDEIAENAVEKAEALIAALNYVPDADTDPEFAVVGL